MYKVWNEIKAGWKEVQWIWYFSLYLILITPLAIFVAYCIEGEFSSSSVVQILFATLATLVSYFLAKSHSNRAKHKKITSSPGITLLAITNFLFSPRTVELTFQPLVADWRYEYFEALKRGQKWKARWISARYYSSFILVIIRSQVFSFLKQLRLVNK